MNQTFSFNRFSLLLRKHWADNKKKYILSILAFIGLLVVWYLFIMLTDTYDPMADGLQQITYLFSLFVTGSLYASQFFSELGSKSKGINYLMVPASTLEKFLCGLLYSVVLFFIVFTLAFYLADVVMVIIANAAHTSYNEVGKEVALQKATVVNIFTTEGFSRNKNINFYAFLLFIIIQSTCLLGSVYFAKYSYIKTAISSFLLVLIIFLIVYVFTKSLLPDGGYTNLTSYRVFENGKDDLLVRMPGWVGNLVSFLAMYSVPPLFWAATYFRLKEKQV